jgi:hypothetical protein
MKSVITSLLVVVLWTLLSSVDVEAQIYRKLKRTDGSVSVDALAQVQIGFGADGDTASDSDPDTASVSVFGELIMWDGGKAYAQQGCGAEISIPINGEAIWPTVEVTTGYTQWVVNESLYHRETNVTGSASANADFIIAPNQGYTPGPGDQFKYSIEFDGFVTGNGDIPQIWINNAWSVTIGRTSITGTFDVEYWMWHVEGTIAHGENDDEVDFYTAEPFYLDGFEPISASESISVICDSGTESTIDDADPDTDHDYLANPIVTLTVQDY